MTKQPPPEPERLLTTGEVAALFRVDPQTAARWCKPRGDKPPRLRAVRTPGGHLRIPYSEVRALLEP